MTRSVEEMNDGSRWVRRHTVGILSLYQVTVDLRTFTAIQVHNLDCESNWFQQHIYKECHPQVINLLIGYL